MTDVIDFSGVPEDIRSGAGSSRIPPGDYLVKIVDHEKRWKDNDRSNPAFYRWRFMVVDGEHKGATLRHNTTLKPEGLFNLRNLIWAASAGKLNVAGRTLKFDPTKIYGKKIAVTVEDDERGEGDKARIYSNVVDMRPADQMPEGVEEAEVETVEEAELAEGEELEEVDLDEL